MRIPEAVIVAVGDELVTGRRLETNGTRIGRWLDSCGCVVRARCIVPDREAYIEDTVRAALASNAELVLVVGGLGPTEDDRTREGVAQALDTELELDAPLLEVIEARYRERGKDVPENAPRQAQRPIGSEAVPNPIGTAPGFIVDRGRMLLVALPGVPREMDQMMQRTVLPLLRARLAGAYVMRARVLHVAGLPEAEVDRRIRGRAGESGAQVTLLESHGEVEVLVTVRAESDDEADERLARALAAIEAPLGETIYGRDAETLVGIVRDQLARRGWTLGAAESFTGGLVGKRVVDLPGSSGFFVGSVVAYSDERKTALLGVAPDVLESAGPVSAAVTLAMAEGVRRQLGCDVGVAATGIAGPGGGTVDKPVGLAYLAVAWPGRSVVRRHVFAGDRALIRSFAATTALDQVRRALGGLPLLGEPAEAGATP